MIYYIFKHQIFTIFLSISHLTAITFPDRIIDYVGGQERDYKVYELNKGRSLVYEPKRKDIDRNFILFQKSGKYHYNIRYNETLSNKDVVIRNAKSCNLFELIEDKKEYQLFECPKSILFVNKTSKKVKVNELVIRNRAYLSKGPPIYLEGKIIYYRRSM